MTSLLGQIGGIAALGSLILSQPASLRKNGTDYHIDVARKHSQKPYRATENRRSYDAQFRVHRPTAGAEPQQNDLIVVGEEEWIIWRIIPSTAGSHWVVECMAPPTVGIIPVKKSRIYDNMGGYTFTWAPMPQAMFYGSIREASINQQLSANEVSVIGRLHLTFRAADVPIEFGESWRVIVDGIGYEILSITVDDENPLWRNSVLAREATS